jgi:hypothetical protein
MKANHSDPVRLTPGGLGDHKSSDTHNDDGGLVLKLLLLIVGVSVVSAFALAVFVMVMRR